MRRGSSSGVRWSSRGKDTGSPDSGAIGATEDAASRRPARPGDSAPVSPGPPRATAQRASLVGFVDGYLEALAANDPSRLPAADGVRFTENAVELPLGKGLWATASGVPDYHYAYVEDEELGQIGWFGVVEESGRPAVVFLRLKVEDGAITEVETIVRREQPQLYEPSNMAAPRTVFFEELDPSERSSREDLIAAAHGYFDGLEQVDSSLIPVVDECIRIENGTQTAGVDDVSHLAGTVRAHIFPLGVRAQVDTGYFSYIDEIRSRRVVGVDESRGLVMLVVVFDHPAKQQSVELRGVGEVELPRAHQLPNSVLIAELFKVRSGKIVHIESVIEWAPYGMPTGWEPERRVS